LRPNQGQFVANCGLNVLQITQKWDCPGQVCGRIETNFIRVSRVIRGQNLVAFGSCGQGCPRSDGKTHSGQPTANSAKLPAIDRSRTTNNEHIQFSKNKPKIYSGELASLNEYRKSANSK